ncbi:HofO family protein [Pantoea dispersa]|uniref:HofO family protein n=1 Tax=Pantoea dispersa TaxID=59814 RepID=UPI002DBD4386|nr:hypothetical protein [Pantoea dispersa]MEB5974064.1 hypothetical protein [Pantoea dispersa]
MNELIQRWLQLSLTWRMLSLLLLALLLLALAWLLLLRPQQQRSSALQQQLSQLAQQYQQRQQQLDARPTIERLQAEIAALQPLAAAASVSLEQLVAARGSQLEAWHPDSQPQQLALRLSWPQFLPLFSGLAATALAVPQRFQLQAEQGVLRTELWLESDDAE